VDGIPDTKTPNQGLAVWYDGVMKQDYLAIALNAVKEAEKVILKYLDQGVRAELKDDQSPVTIADREAEEIIKNTILAAFPDHTFYGEEGEKVNLENHQGYTWIIDPIDGTKSYLRGNPLFATQLALLHDGEFILGISNAPLLKELLYAEKGKGCFLNDNPVHVSDVTTIDQAYMSFGSLKYFTKHDNIQQLLELAEEARWARGIGDFWSYHLLVQGKLDIMIEADTKLWDIAAMKVIVEEAGGRFTQLDGQDVSQATRTALATNGSTHDAVVAKFNS
jgi:histidinol-phosphatase